MNKIGLFYSFNTKRTKVVAQKVHEAFGKDKIDPMNVEDMKDEDFIKYDNNVIVISTWFDGELPNSWDEFIPAMEELQLKGRKFAIVGLGNQHDYGQNFCDAVGILGETIEDLGGKLVGSTSTEGYNFESSKSIRSGKFMGLMIDQDTQAKQTKKRIADWVKQIEKEF
jgi:flavodoxin I